jgi:hypothetical protein
MGGEYDYQKGHSGFQRRERAAARPLDGTVLPSPVTGKRLYFELVEIKSKDVKNLTVKSKYNTRNSDYLSAGSVLDIFPSIKEANFNSFPALGIRNSESDLIEILSGMRRRESVSMLEDGTFYIYVAKDDISDEEQKAFAKVADIHLLPNIVDKGLFVLQLLAENDKLDIESAGAQVGLGRTATFKAKKFAAFPSSLYKLFPSLTQVTYSWLEQITKDIESDRERADEIFTNMLEDGEGIAPDIDADEVELEKQCTALRSRIKRALNPKSAAKIVSTEQYKSLPTHSGVGIKTNAYGDVVVTLKSGKLAPDKLSELLYSIVDTQTINEAQQELIDTTLAAFKEALNGE